MFLEMLLASSFGFCILLFYPISKFQYGSPFSHERIHTKTLLKPKTPKRNAKPLKQKRSHKPKPKPKPQRQSHVIRCRQSRQVRPSIHSGSNHSGIEARCRSRSQTRKLTISHPQTKLPLQPHFQVACGAELLCGIDASLSHSHCFCIA